MPSTSIVLRLADRLGRRAPIVAAVFVVGVLSHATALAWPSASDTSPPWRHLLFLAINASLCTAFALRWRWLPIPCTALVAQQAYSHGSDLLTAARAGHLDLPSLAVLLVLPWIALAAIGVARSPPERPPPTPLSGPRKRAEPRAPT